MPAIFVPRKVSVSVENSPTVKDPSPYETCTKENSLFFLYENQIIIFFHNVIKIRFYHVIPHKFIFLLCD